ncbi:hypothetical protein [Niallia sp. FSL R7-0271]|uniref:hypothetical protein n=1 Tax=Niallia sp. FSL R7-0271 TaxID=2921678 RepID=UPI0030F53E2B
MSWIVRKGHWFLLLVVCFSLIKDLTTSTHISVKILSILCLFAALFVVLTIEKGRKRIN